MSAKYLDIIDASNYVKDNVGDFEGIKIHDAIEKIKTEAGVVISAQVTTAILDKFGIKRYGKGSSQGKGTHETAKLHNKVRDLSLFVVKLAEAVDYPVSEHIFNMARPYAMKKEDK